MSYWRKPNGRDLISLNFAIPLTVNLKQYNVTRNAFWSEESLWIGGIWDFSAMKWVAKDGLASSYKDRF